MRYTVILRNRIGCDLDAKHGSSIEAIMRDGTEVPYVDGMEIVR